MKNKSNKEKLLLLVCIIIILAGTILLCTIGFNKSIEYSSGKRIEIYIPKGYEKQDVITLAKESFLNKEMEFVDVEKLNQVAGIKVEKYTEEELNSFKTKIKEKYQIEDNSLQIYEIDVPETRISTLVMPYVLPVLLVTLLTLLYIYIRNLKLNDNFKILLKIILTLAIVLGIYFSIILIFRIQVTSYTKPLALMIYILTLLIKVNNIEK